VRALVINSGNANAGTGVAGSNKGLDNAYQVCEMVAQSLDIDTEQRCCGFRHKRDNRQIQLLSIFNL
jgi:N-acetylglutamate synthase/N-acetylornithine aminotransferase